MLKKRKEKKTIIGCYVNQKQKNGNYRPKKGEMTNKVANQRILNYNRIVQGFL